MDWTKSMAAHRSTDTPDGHDEPDIAELRRDRPWSSQDAGSNRAPESDGNAEAHTQNAL